MSSADDGRSWWAVGLVAIVVLEVGTAVVGGLLAGFDAGMARDSFALTNSAIAVSLAVAGGLIAWHRRRNPLGWLLLAAAIMQGATAACAPLVWAGVAGGWPVTPLLATVAGAAWPWSISVFLPLALLVFPTGAVPGPRWRPVVGLVLLAGSVFAIGYATEPGSLAPGALSYLAIPEHAALAPLWTAGELGVVASYAAALAGLGLRYRRGDEPVRRQLLWLVLAVGAMIVAVVLWDLAPAEAGAAVLVLLAIPLVPAAMTIAVLRHQLLDIRFVVSRALLYGLLTAGVIGAYLGLVAVGDLVLRAGIGPSLLATLLVAVAFNPVRVRLQRLVDRALYGDRADPVAVLARMGERLAADPDAAVVLDTVRDVLRLPYAALRAEGAERAASGVPPTALESVPLEYRGERIGELVVGVRSGQRSLDRPDRAALRLLAVPLAVAVHATALSDELQRSRREIVAAREEERRRLRRDLHDGLGPALTGIAFRTDAAGNLLRSDPAEAARLLTELRGSATEALDDVRRLVHALRPPALDELGLAGALRRQAEQLGGATITVDVQALPRLSAAVEVAAYRIAVEALTNAVRHAAASHVDVRLSVADGLEIAVRDDGASAAPWAAGVGLASIRERTAELGGACRAGPEPGGGGVVWARIPLEAADG